MPFGVVLLVDGMLVGTIDPLITLAFIVVYKASRMMSFTERARQALRDQKSAEGQPAPR